MKSINHKSETLNSFTESSNKEICSAGIIENIDNKNNENVFLSKENQCQLKDNNKDAIIHQGGAKKEKERNLNCMKDNSIVKIDDNESEKANSITNHNCSSHISKYDYSKFCNNNRGNNDNNQTMFFKNLNISNIKPKTKGYFFSESNHYPFDFQGKEENGDKDSNESETFQNIQDPEYLQESQEFKEFENLEDFQNFQHRTECLKSRDIKGNKNDQEIKEYNNEKIIKETKYGKIQSNSQQIKCTKEEQFTPEIKSSINYLNNTNNYQMRQRDYLNFFNHLQTTRNSKKIKNKTTKNEFLNDQNLCSTSKLNKSVIIN